MLKKIFLPGLLIIAIAITLTACGAGNATPQSTQNIQSAEGTQNIQGTSTQTQPVEKTFTKDELAKYDGKNGNKAYIAVDGVVYDVTDVPQWQGGSHKGVSAGKDVTNEFNNQSPHDKSIFDGVPVVGKYVG